MDEEDEPSGTIASQKGQGEHSTTYDAPSDDDYDVVDATSECTSSGSETGSMFERRISAFRNHYSESRSEKFVNRQAAIARCRREYTTQWKETYTAEERQI